MNNDLLEGIDMEWEDLPPVFPVLERLASPTRPLFLGKRNKRSPGTNARYNATANATKKAKANELNQLIRALTTENLKFQSTSNEAGLKLVGCRQTLQQMKREMFDAGAKLSARGTQVRLPYFAALILTY